MPDINSDTFSNGEEVKFTGKIKGSYTTHYTYEYVISSIDSIESINKDE